MIGLKNFRKNGPIRRALPALAISAVGVLAMIGAILVHHSAGLSPYFVPAATALLNLFLIYVIGLFDGDADGEVFVAGIFFLALLSLISGLAWFLVALRLEWWIYVLIAALLLGALILVYSGALRKKYRGGPHYFSTFGIILVPIQFSQPISETEAVQREKDGSVYYLSLIHI